MQTGRVAQKNRTRKALIRAAWELLLKGVQPTVEEVAEAADISRATAYRYFPSRERLLIEAVLSRESVSSDEVLSAEEGKPPVDRVARVHSYVQNLVAKNETLYRSLVRSSLEEWMENKDRLVLRADQRLELLDAALRPVSDKISKGDLDNLTCALAAMVGVESYIALRDVCQLSKNRSREVMAWAIRKLVSTVTLQADGER
jgi:AcrR family transcriptional regulator